MYIFDDIRQEGEQDWRVRFIKLNEKEYQAFVFNSFEKAILFSQITRGSYVKLETIQNEYVRFK